LVALPLAGHTEQVQQIFTAIRAAVYGGGFVLLWWWVGVQVRPLDQRLGFALPEWSVPVGVLLGTAGAILALSCLVVFVHFGRGTAAPFDPPRNFVAVGPYRFVRNPMYIGGFMVILGFGLVLRSPCVAILALVFAGVFHLFVTVYEEPSLERRFGESYSEYKRRVRRWLPRLDTGHRQPCE
jgi:protein-S-isoprenylcysteine O-methyltransferase Ste14